MMTEPLITKPSCEQVRANAQAFRADLIAMLKERGQMGVSELVAATGAAADKIRSHMNRMTNEGRIEKQMIAGKAHSRGGTRVTVYRALDYAEIDEDAPKRPRPKAYPLHHVRDSLVAALFGPAKQQHGDLTK